MAIYKTAFTRAQIEQALYNALNVIAEGKSFVLRGAWQSGASYSNTAESMDVVIYDGVSYYCLVSHSGQSTPPPDDPTRWAQLAGYEPLIKNAPEDELDDDDALIFIDVSDGEATKKISFEDFKMMMPAGGSAPLQLRATETHIQWRAVGETDWTDLVPLSAITGPQGEQGPKGDSGAKGEKGDKGDAGRGIVSIARTSGTGAPGTTDTYTITYSDSTTSTFQVYNGADGEGSGDMMQAVYDPDGDGIVKAADVAYSVDWTNVQGRPVIPTALADLEQDSSHRTVTDAEKATWNSKQDALGFTPVPNTRKVNGKALSSDITLDAADIGAVPTTRKVNNKALSQDITLSASDVGAIPASQKGTANGVAELDANGKVPSSQLPSYVDDVLEYDKLSSFPSTGETGKIYIARDTNLCYRWSGSGYVEISPSLALGETATTAYRGDRGKIAYDHSQTTGNPHSTTPADIGAAASGHTHSDYMPKSGGTFTGIVTAQSNTSYTTPQIRNIVLSTSDPSGGNDGEIWIKYQ